MSQQSKTQGVESSGARWWLTPLAAALASIAGGGVGPYINGALAATQKRSTEYHNLFQQALRGETAEDARYATLFAVCQQNDDEELRRSARSVVVGLAASCWATCEPRLIRCEQGGATREECEKMIECDEICDLLTCAARGDGCTNNAAPRCSGA